MAANDQLLLEEDTGDAVLLEEDTGDILLLEEGAAPAGGVKPPSGLALLGVGT